MIAIAMGPQKTLRVSGIIARIADAAVSTTGLERRTVASMTESQRLFPSPMSCSI